MNKTLGTGTETKYLRLFTWKMESEGLRIFARSAGQISEEDKADQESSEENERSDGKDVDCNATFGPWTVRTLVL